MHATKQQKHTLQEPGNRQKETTIKSHTCGDTVQCRFTETSTNSPTISDPFRGLGIMQRKVSPLADSANSNTKQPTPAALPRPLRRNLETLSSLNLGGVRVHHNSPLPARVGALAYTQGTNIHLGPNQQRHLPHEGWHVVQQMQGRVKASQNSNGVAINDSPKLEREADVMGAKAVRAHHTPSLNTPTPESSQASPVQQHKATNQSDQPIQCIRGKRARRWLRNHGVNVIADNVALNAQKALTPIAAIDARHTGDMYHVRAVMSLFPAAHALVRYDDTNDGECGNAVMMWKYFASGNRAARVHIGVRNNLANPRSVSLPRATMLLGANANNIPANQNDSYFSETSATSYISAKMQIGGERVANTDALTDGMAGDVATDAKYAKDIQQRGGFPMPHVAGSYVFVNYRSSGQRAGGVHPALDTGENGMNQLLTAANVRFNDATVVPVGDYAPPAWPAQPTLINYWRWPSASGGRSQEAGLLQYMNNNYNVKGVIGMRSGVMDLFAFLGFKVVSIDRQNETGYQRARDKTQAGLGNNWFRYAEMTTARAGERRGQMGTGVAHWAGTIDNTDLGNIIDEAEDTFT